MCAIRRHVLEGKGSLSNPQKYHEGVPPTSKKIFPKETGGKRSIVSALPSYFLAHGLHFFGTKMQFGGTFRRERGTPTVGDYRPPSKNTVLGRYHLPRPCCRRFSKKKEVRFPPPKNGPHLFSKISDNMVWRGDTLLKKMVKKGVAPFGFP